MNAYDQKQWERYYARIQDMFSNAVRGDFATGQRKLPTSAARLGTFATGQRWYWLEMKQGTIKEGAHAAD